MRHPSVSEPESNLPGPSDAALWAGLFLGPAAWALHMQVNYSLVLWVCKTGHENVLHLVTTAFLALGFMGFLVSWHCWLASGPQARGVRMESAQARGRFMAGLGLMSSVLFMLIIIAQGIATFMVSPCQT